MKRILVFCFIASRLLPRSSPLLLPRYRPLRRGGDPGGRAGSHRPTPRASLLPFPARHRRERSVGFVQSGSPALLPLGRVYRAAETRFPADSALVCASHIESPSDTEGSSGACRPHPYEPPLQPSYPKSPSPVKGECTYSVHRQTLRSPKEHTHGMWTSTGPWCTYTNRLSSGCTLQADRT